jgi:hypothetical protein
VKVQVQVQVKCGYSRVLEWNHQLHCSAHPSIHVIVVRWFISLCYHHPRITHRIGSNRCCCYCIIVLYNCCIALHCIVCHYYSLDPVLVHKLPPRKYQVRVFFNMHRRKAARRENGMAQERARQHGQKRVLLPVLLHQGILRRDFMVVHHRCL